MAPGERLMNLRGITAVILMVGLMGITSIIGMVLIAIVHDGDLSTGVISNLEAISVGAVGVAGTLIVLTLTKNCKDLNI